MSDTPLTDAVWTGGGNILEHAKAMERSRAKSYADIEDLENQISDLQASLWEMGDAVKDRARLRLEIASFYDAFVRSSDDPEPNPLVERLYQAASSAP